MAASPAVFQVGDLVLYQTKLCIIEGIVNTAFGYKTFNIADLDTGVVLSVSKHELVAVEDLDITTDIPEMDWDIELQVTGESTVDAAPVDAAPVEVDAAAVEVDAAKKTRHVLLTDEEVDHVAKERLAANTEYQTRWAVTLFRGKNIQNNG